MQIKANKGEVGRFLQYFCGRPSWMTHIKQRQHRRDAYRLRVCAVWSVVRLVYLCIVTVGSLTHWADSDEYVNYTDSYIYYYCCCYYHPPPPPAPPGWVCVITCKTSLLMPFTRTRTYTPGPSHTGAGTSVCVCHVCVLGGITLRVLQVCVCVCMCGCRWCDVCGRSWQWRFHSADVHSRSNCWHRSAAVVLYNWVMISRYTSPHH